MLGFSDDAQHPSNNELQDNSENYEINADRNIDSASDVEAFKNTDNHSTIVNFDTRSTIENTDNRSTIDSNDEISTIDKTDNRSTVENTDNRSTIDNTDNRSTIDNTDNRSTIDSNDDIDSENVERNGNAEKTELDEGAVNLVDLAEVQILPEPHDDDDSNVQKGQVPLMIQ